MGANAVTTVPVYVAGEVLTAADLNITNSGIPVFADTTARDNSFGGSGEKVLAEGQFAYIEASNATQYYDGAAWQSVGSTPGLVYLTGATFTAATSVSLPDNTFTATYRNYRMLLDITAVTADADFTMRMRASGADNTSAVYNSMQYGLSDAAAASNVTQSNQTSWNVGEQDAVEVRYALVIDIIRPQVAAITNVSMTNQFVNKAASNNFMRVGGMLYGATTQFDSLSFISSVASSITGQYRVYGYANS
jgi:hypothetical protein